MKEIDITDWISKTELEKRKMKIIKERDSFMIRSYKSIPVKFPRLLKIDHDLGIFVGLILTEGMQSKTKKSRNTFTLMNTDPDVIKVCLRLLESLFSIRPEIPKMAIYLPPSMKDNGIEVEKGWRRNLHIDEHAEIKRYLQKDLKRSKFSVFIYRSTFRFVTDIVIEESLKYLNEKEFRRGFLRGVFCAEGSVELRKKSLHFVNFSQCNDKNRSLIKKALMLSGIRFKERLNPHSKGIRISHMDNFEKIDNLEICTISKRKQRKFKVGLLNLKKDPRAGRSVTQTKREIIDILGKRGQMTMNGISKELGLSYFTIWDHIFRKRGNVKGLFEEGALKCTNCYRPKGRPEKILELKEI